MVPHSPFLALFFWLFLVVFAATSRSLDTAMVCHCGSQRSSDEPQWTSAMRAATGDSRDISALTKAHFAPVTINFNSFCSHPGAYQGRGSINDYGYMPPAVDAPFLDQRAMQAWPNAGGSNGDGNAMMSFANSLPHMSTYQHQVRHIASCITHKHTDRSPRLAIHPTLLSKISSEQVL